MGRLPSRRLEVTAAWTVVALAWLIGLLGLVGPHLGGSGPGLRGPVGFASETVAAIWVPGGLAAATVTVAALLRRLWWPAAALVPLTLLVLVPEAWAGSRSPAVRSQANGPTLRVATVNLAAQNRDDPGMEACLRQIDADVLVLSEFTSSWARRLEAWLVDDYPFRLVARSELRPGYANDGLRLAVWSRLPLAGGHEVRNLRGVNSQIRVLLEWRGRTFALYGIHPAKPWPFRSYARAWRDRKELLEWIGSERLPTIVAGDFNAPPRSVFVERLRGIGLISASEAVLGRAPTTWPMSSNMYVPVRIAIDHVMYGEDFRAVDFRRGPLTESDHAPVVADLIWRDG